MKRLFTITITILIAFTIGFLSGQTYFNYRKVLNKESFSSIEEERNFLIEANDVKFELILMYDGAINATDSIEEQYYLSRIDSLYDLEY